ncbi:MAG: ABC transporter permease [Treponema sp.]|jgi:peptide/nickel transport system permease protein|nr:ABC transporter permease [Treponema sp.]
MEIRNKRAYRAAAYIIKKLFRVLLLVSAASVISFLLVKASPIDPVVAYVGGAHAAQLTPSMRMALEKKWGLDRSPVEQYFIWLKNMLHGDMGRSIIYNQDVLAVIGEKFKASLALMGTAWVISGAAGFLMGLLAGKKPGGMADRLVRWYSVTLASSPLFWVGLLLIIIFSVNLGWLPVGLGVPIGKAASEVTLWDRMYHLILPALTLSITGVANIALHTREKFAELRQSEFILYARVKGEGEASILRRHILRNIAMPAITLQFASISELFGGSVLAETVFAYPGLGGAVSEAGLRGDIPLLLGLVLFSVLFVFTGNFIANILYTILDPRIKEGVEHA